MSKTLRIDILENLLKGVFGNKNVNIIANKIRINDNGTKVTCYSLKSMSKFRMIFNVTFNCENVNFEDKDKGMTFNLSKKEIMNNTIKYFRGLGVYIPEVVNLTERYLLGKRMCKAILEHILPAIYCNTENDDGKSATDYDDISIEYNKAIDCIRNDFNTEDFFEKLYVDIKASEIEKIYDSDYSKNECDYGLCVCSWLPSMFYVFKSVPSIYYYAYVEKLVLYKDLSNLNGLFDDCFNYSEQLQYSFEELTARFINKNALEYKNFVSPYYYNTKQEYCINKTVNFAKEYRLHLNVKIPNLNFIPRYFYFMTKLNDTIIDEKYPECTSPIDLERTLREKAIEQMRIKCTEEIALYYMETLANIEDVCRKFLTIDIKTILSQKISDCTGFKKALSSLCNENEISTVWEFCIDNKLDTQKTSRYIYCGIEDSIRDYICIITSLIKDGCENKSSIFHEIEGFISKTAILKHTSTLSNLLTEFNIDSLIKLRDKYKSFTWSTNKGFNLDYYIEGHEQSVDKGEQNIYKFMQTSITDYCAALRNVVNRD
ncbi:hypothetical protein [Ruminococcus sp. XPD3002]|uniref:hypothetical protein n=1 Tax=Ruminococcus sp. XPD3002 TaxID=1452269 RepID=UPI000917331B|nr:hypothetical protein SAMN04487832_12414 [Ruminococcus flavefaciens]